MAVPTSAARLRSSAGRSEVATITTLLRKPSGPRLSSTNSRTSRPRSPTSTMTLTSDAAPRASIPSSVLLPPPAAAKMPTRWPTPTLSVVSMARTPVGRASWIGVRSIGFGASRCSGALALPCAALPPSSGAPCASSTRPSRPSPTVTEARPVTACTSMLAETPSSAPSGVSKVCCRDTPTTSALRIWPVAGSRSSQTSPIAAGTPLARIRVP